MKKGQILLIIVMVLATIMTVVLAITFKSSNEAKTAKLEQENQKALAAAEAAVEAALQSNNNVTIGEGLLESLTGITGSATVQDLITNVFTTSAIAKDAAYTFYLSDYDPETKTFTGTSRDEDVTVCFDSATPNPAIEITLLKTDSVKKYVIDPSTRITNAYASQGVCSANADFDYSYIIPGADISTDSKILYVRVMYGASKLIFSRTSDFPIQGRIANSEVVTDTGVSKKVTLFQTYPQIPAEFLQQHNYLKAKRGLEAVHDFSHNLRDSVTLDSYDRDITGGMVWVTQGGKS